MKCVLKVLDRMMISVYFRKFLYTLLYSKRVINSTIALSSIQSHYMY